MSEPKLIDGCWVTVREAARVTGGDARQIQKVVAAHFIRGTTGPDGTVYVHHEELMGIRRGIGGANRQQSEGPHRAIISGGQLGALDYPAQVRTVGSGA